MNLFYHYKSKGKFKDKDFKCTWALVIHDKIDLNIKN